MKQKAESIISAVIKRLSRGESMSTDDIVREYNVAASSFKERFKDIREKFYSRSIRSDKSTGKWIRKEKQFLENMLLTAEETVILTGILRKKNEFGDNLADEVVNIVNKYIKRTKTSVYKQDSLEKIDAVMEKKFAKIKYAIDSSQQIDIKIHGYKATVFPYKIICLEYYWYLFGYESQTEAKSETNKVKTYTIAKIESIEVLKETFKYDFSDAKKELANAMNAYFDISEESMTIEVLVVSWFTQYIERAHYFSGWNFTGHIEKIDNQDYHVYEIKSTNKEYKDIIPTIFTYMPHIRIRNDEDVVKAMFKNIEEFASYHNKKLIEKTHSMLPTLVTPHYPS